MTEKDHVPSDRLYTKDHEWALEREDGIEVGITAFAVDQLGDVTLVNIDAKEGELVTAGKPFGTIESVKTLSDLFSPVSGRVLRINRELDTNPERVNEDPYGAAWMIVIAPSEGAERSQLLTPDAYRQLLSSVH